MLQYPPNNSYLLSEQKQPSILFEQKQPSLLSSDTLHIQNVNPVSNNIGTVPTRLFNKPKKIISEIDSISSPQTNEKYIFNNPRKTSLLDDYDIKLYNNSSDDKSNNSSDEDSIFRRNNSKSLVEDTYPSIEDTIVYTTEEPIPIISNETSQILNPKSNKYIQYGGFTHKSLIREGKLDNVLNMDLKNNSKFKKFRKNK